MAGVIVLDPVVVQGNDGSNDQTIATDSSGRQKVLLYDANGNVLVWKDIDTGAGTEYAVPVTWRKEASGGSLEFGTAGSPVRIDPTGASAQPVTDNGGSLTVDALSWPLPTGASTEATLAEVNARLGDESTPATGTVNKQLANLVSTVATQTTLASLETILTAVRDTAGVKKITDPLPTGTNDLGGVRLRDQHGKDAQFAAFGLLKTATESILGDYRFNSTDTPNEFAVVETGTGALSYEPGGTGAKLNTGASASSKVTLTSNRTHYYQSGRGQLSKFSIILGDTGVAGNIREWGYADADNGVLFRLDGTTLSLVVRLNSAETLITSDNWDTPVTPDQYGHLFYIQFEWLGVGNFFVYYDEQIVHTYNFLGTSTGLSIGSPDLPLWFRNENTTNDTDVYLKLGCASVCMEGGIVISGQDPNGKLHQFNVDEQGQVKVVFAASGQALPLLVNMNYEQSDGAILANAYKRVLDYVVPAGYDGWLIRYSSFQNETAKSRLVAYKELGDYDYLTNTFTSGADSYEAPQWTSVVEAHITTETSAAGASPITSTVTYTNHAGVTGRTGTFTIPKGAAVGERFMLALQSGDVGLLSIQSISDDSPNAGAYDVVGNIQLAYHNNLSNTIQLETNYQPGAIAFPTGTKLAVEYAGGTVSKDRLFDILIQLVEEAP